MGQLLPHKPRNVDAGHALLEAFLTEFARAQTIQMEQLASLVVNHVLECSLVVLPAEGYITRAWHLPCGAVSITPALITGPLTIVSGSATSERAPSQGVGMGQVVYPTQVGAYQAVVFNLSAHAVTIYGNAGDRFTLQAFTHPQPPA